MVTFQRAAFAVLAAVLLPIGCGGGGGGNSCSAPDYSCGAGEFCQLEAGSCGAEGAGGSCVVIPSVCTQEFAPVCSCDGLTFSNQCFAEGGGHSTRGLGACP